MGSIDLDQDKWRDLEKARALLLSGRLTPLEISEKTQIPHQTVKNLRQKVRYDPDALVIVSWIRVETLAQLFDNECRSIAKDGEL